MGTTAPVGSLLWVAPVDARDADEVRVGDVITYRAPGGRHGTYTHRVIERVDGGVRTAGDLTSPDPWVVGPDDVVGEVRLTWRGVGWVVVAAPVLVPGALLALAWAACLPRRRRPAALLVAAAVVVAVGVAVYRPLVGVERIASRPVPGGAEVTVVGTGLLPARVSAGHGPVASTAPTVRVGAGETATLTVRAAPGATLPLRVRADVGATGYLLLAALCLAPALLRRIRGAARARRRAPAGVPTGTATTVL